jgi:hypothetical protein
MNKPTVQRTVFTNHHNNSKSYGFRVYDDYGQTYCNILEESGLKKSDEEFLVLVSEMADDVADAMLDFAMDHGITIDDVFYDAEWVRSVLNKN